VDPHLARALLSAWQVPQFRDALQHLIDLDEVTGLLAALAAGAPDEQTRRRLLELLHTASDDDRIRSALLLLIADDAFRVQLSQAVANALSDRPALALSLSSAIADRAVADEVVDILGATRTRAALWKAVESQLQGRRFGLLTAGVALVARRRVRQLLRALHRHGVFRALRQGTPDALDHRYIASP
jgi:hypothetical protein